MRRLWWYATLGLAIGYGLFILGWEVLRHTRVAGWWAFQLVDLFALTFFLPLLPLAALFALGRNRLALLTLTVPLMVFAMGYGELFVPSRVQANGLPLRVMTANVEFSNADAAGIAALLRAQRIDVVALQELNEPMAAALAALLHDDYPYQALHPHPNPFFGMGVLSRLPLDVALAETPPDFDDNRCYCQYVTVAVEGRAAHVLNVHSMPAPRPALRPLAYTPRLQHVPRPAGFNAHETASSVETFAARVAALDAPRLALGDFNTTDRQPAYASLLAQGQLKDAYHAVGKGFGFTFPADGYNGLPIPPVVRIDYVLHDAAWAAKAAWTGAIPGSDHRYVAAELVLE